MTDTTQYLKQNLFSISTLIVLIGFVVQQSKWQENIESRVHYLEMHAADKEVHMPSSVKFKTFIPRTELNGRLENIDKNIDEIKDDLKKSLKV